MLFELGGPSFIARREQFPIWLELGKDTMYSQCILDSMQYVGWYMSWIYVLYIICHVYIIYTLYNMYTRNTLLLASSFHLIATKVGLAVAIIVVHHIPHVTFPTVATPFPTSSPPHRMSVECWPSLAVLKAVVVTAPLAWLCPSYCV